MRNCRCTVPLILRVRWSCRREDLERTTESRSYWRELRDREQCRWLLPPEFRRPVGELCRGGSGDGRGFGLRPDGLRRRPPASFPQALARTREETCGGKRDEMEEVVEEGRSDWVGGLGEGVRRLVHWPEALSQALQGWVDRPAWCGPAEHRWGREGRGICLLRPAHTVQQYCFN